MAAYDILILISFPLRCFSLCYYLKFKKKKRTSLSFVSFFHGQPAGPRKKNHLLILVLLAHKGFAFFVRKHSLGSSRGIISSLVLCVTWVKYQVNVQKQDEWYITTDTLPRLTVDTEKCSFYCSVLRTVPLIFLFSFLFLFTITLQSSFSGHQLL